MLVVTDKKLKYMGIRIKFRNILKTLILPFFFLFSKTKKSEEKIIKNRNLETPVKLLFKVTADEIGNRPLKLPITF